MQTFAAALPLLLLLCCAAPAIAQEQQKPDAIMEKMAFKLVRGLANVTTSIVELPKQSYLTVRDRGGIGYLIGPMKGFGMTVYRAFIGVTETVFFMVPQPGYYDPMIDPDYVWNGWEEKRVEHIKPQEPEQVASPTKEGE
ncbi:MAG: exosortase system-associated protein, TIGR04073 family [Geobacteraceae bacterium]